MIKRFLLAALFLVSVGGSAVAVSVPQTALAAPDCKERFLTFPAWYRGLTEGADCDIKSPKDVGGISNFIWAIVANVVEIMLQAVAYVSLAFILYGGFRYLTGGGTSDQIVGARKTIVNAVIGLIVSFFAILVVNLVIMRIV